MDLKDYKEGHRGNNFWFRAKREMINILLTRLNNKNLKILDLGAGTGDDLIVLNNYGNVYVLDHNKEALHEIPDNLCKEKKVGDAENLPYKSDYFEVVVAFDVFEHINNDKTAIIEIKRVLKKDGFLIFTVPAFQFLLGSHDKALGHKRRYNKKSIKLLLRDFNFYYLSYWNFFMFIPIAFFRIIRKKHKQGIDPFSFNKYLDNLLYNLLKIDNFLVKKGYNLPFGLSIIGICQNNGDFRRKLDKSLSDNTKNV